MKKQTGHTAHTYLVSIRTSHTCIYHTMAHVFCNYISSSQNIRWRHMSKYRTHSRESYDVAVAPLLYQIILHLGQHCGSHKTQNDTSHFNIVIGDTLMEYGFNLLVYLTNLWVIFSEQDFINMFCNTLVMEWLMDMDNEFQKTYFSYLPGVAEDIYDNLLSHTEKTLSWSNKITRICQIQML